jgi:ribosomal protein S13
MVKPFLFNKRINFNNKANTIFKSIFGIGYRKSSYLHAQYGITMAAHINQLPKRNSRFQNIEAMINSNFLVDTHLRRINSKAINFAVQFNAYKGKRRAQGLPFSGQRTHSNARTTRRLFRTRTMTTKLARAGIVGAKSKKGKK